MDEKLRFVARYLDGEKIAALCREFGISRVAGHSIIDRYRDRGMEAFTDRSRRPLTLRASPVDRPSLDRAAMSDPGPPSNRGCGQQRPYNLKASAPCYLAGATALALACNAGR